MDGNRNYYGGGGGGNRNYRGGGGNRHRSYRGGGRRGRGYRHQPYGSRGGRGGGGGRGNRFGQQQQQDPETVLFRQIASFVSRVGEFQNLRQPPEDAHLRSVEFTTASNINDLLPILCAPDKLEMLMKHSPDASKVEDKVGKMVHLVISCTSGLPLQTPCYAALTLALHEQVKGNPQFEGFALRCLQYAMLQIAKELDTTALTPNPKAAQSTCRLKLLLRYLCILSKMGMVQAYEGETSVDPSRMTVVGFLSVLVDAATAAAEQFSSPTTSYWLAMTVLSTLPYVMELPSVPADVIEEKLRKPIERILSNYRSTFTPGTGMTALLLKSPQVDEDEEEEDDDEEEEEDDDEEEGGGRICDSLQDLLRATKYWRKEGLTSRFALPLDAPWKGLMLRSTPNPDSGDEIESRPITYADAPLHLAFPQECQLLNLLLGGAGSDSPLKLQLFSLEGAVFGRLPIFGSPPDPDDDDEDDEDEMEDGGVKNEHLQAYKSMSLLDRYFVAETMRDCLLSHESFVNPTGVELGSAKSAAEELLRVCHIFSTNAGEDSSKGFDFAILETIFALLAQAHDKSSLRHVFLTRVLLELTRLEPSRLSQGLALAMTTLFDDYLPALVPSARENLSRWFGTHLANTDYQWPSAYWQIWEPYATSDKASSRGEFVRRSLHVMTENLCDPTPIAKQCFGSVAQSLVGEMMARSCLSLEESAVSSLESEIHRRVWDNQEDPALLLGFLQGEEVSQALSAGEPWSRTDVLVRVLMDPARELHENMKAALEKVTGEVGADEDDMEDDSAFSKDVYTAITDSLARYKATILGVLEKDVELKGDPDKQVSASQGAAYLLRRIESIAAFNSGLLEGIVEFVVKNRIVSELAVLRWALRDVGDSKLAPILSSWSTFAGIAVKEGVLLVSNDATAGGVMSMDGAGMDTKTELANKSFEKVATILQYAIPRVCDLLATTQQGENKMTPIQVDLVEGVKSLVFASKMCLFLMLTKSSGIRRAFLNNEVDDVMAKSGISGASLVGLCTDGQGSTAIGVLKKTLEYA